MRSLIRIFRTVLCIGGMFASVALPAMGEIRFTSQMLTVMDGQERPIMTMTTEVKGQRQRVETRTQMGPMAMRRITITMCDRHQKVDINPDAQMYTIGAINPMEPMMSPMATMHRRRHAHSSATGAGRVVSTFHVDDKGTEKVGQFHARHYVGAVETQLSGCAGDGTSSYRLELWVVPGSIAFNCPERSKPVHEIDNNGCKITYEMKGDFARFAEIMKGLVVQQKFEGEHGTFIQRITDYSNAALQDADFEVPAGFKQVTLEEFELATMRGMMQRIPRAPDGDR